MADRFFAISAKRDFPYYRKVWKKVVTILIAAAFLPLVMIGGGIYVYMAAAIKHKTMEVLKAETNFLKKTIDSFLIEKKTTLKFIPENSSLSEMSEFFNAIDIRVPGKMNGDVFLINRQGTFQTNPRHGGERMIKIQGPPPDRFKGARLETKGSNIILTTWLETIPWLLVVEVDKREIFKDSRKGLIIILFVFLLSGFLMILSILFTTDSLVSMLEEKRKKKHRLDSRLRRTVFLSSSVKLAKGVFSDLNDIFSNIHVTATLMKEQAGPANLPENDMLAKQIFSESIRGKNLIDSFIRFVAPKDPVIMDVDIHMVLNRIIDFLKAPLIEKNIHLITDFQAGLPVVRSDVTVLRQVFLNFLLNASAVVGTNGTIDVSTVRKEHFVMVLISDDGPGLGKADMDQIFNLQHLTKRGDWGFGLSICQFIMKQIGGNVSVKNKKKQGVIFEVQVPEAFIGSFPDSEPMIMD